MAHPLASIDELQCWKLGISSKDVDSINWKKKNGLIAFLVVRLSWTTVNVNSRPMMLITISLHMRIPSASATLLSTDISFSCKGTPAENHATIVSS